ncbi:MAG: response regulator [Limnohabitans sp.]|nr:response regulator [Limnohabitans sp.]
MATEKRGLFERRPGGVIPTCCASPETSMLAPAAPRFLVVDDQIVHRLCARVILQHAWPGCVVEEANSLRWARAFLAERHYDLMLLDFHLPDGIGIELLQPSQPARPAWETPVRVPGIGMSSDRTPAILLACAQAGLDTLLDKPLQADELRQAVHHHLPAPSRVMSAAEAMMQASPEISHDVTSRRSAPSAHLCHHLPPRRG